MYSYRFIPWRLLSFFSSSWLISHRLHKLITFFVNSKQTQEHRQKNFSIYQIPSFLLASIEILRNFVLYLLLGKYLCCLLYNCISIWNYSCLPIECSTVRLRLYDIIHVILADCLYFTLPARISMLTYHTISRTTLQRVQRITLYWLL